MLNGQFSVGGAPLSRSAFIRTAGAALVGTLAPPIASCAAQPRSYAMSISRDLGCGCCHGWAVLMQRTGRFQTTLTDEADMSALKRRLGVPADLASCHTATVERLVVEGHVPAEDVLRLLETRPRGIVGLAVPGMPLGSPGMEQPDGRREAFIVYAFGPDGRRDAFTHHGA